MSCTEESFLKDVADHKMEILRDDGVYRHVRFAKPGTNSYAFNLITGPGFLLYRGDMGCYEFERLYDMFEFFRCDDKALAYHKSKGRNIPVNLKYWAEKLNSIDKYDGFKKFSYEVFKSNVIATFKDYAKGITIEDRKLLKNAIRQEILCDFDNSYEAHEATSGFVFVDSKGNRRRPFDDFWDYDNDDYTIRYIWCCYAIAWGIMQYDKESKQAESIIGGI
jgi:hypothetical protein